MIVPTSTPPQDKPFPFLDLPAELRNAIYELCLVKGTVYLTPRPEYDHRYNGTEPFETPEWVLLRISHQIRTEAAKILLGENHFVLSHDYRSEDKFWSPFALSPFILSSIADEGRANRLRNSFPAMVWSHLKSVSITIDLRTIASDPIKIASILQQQNRDVTGLTPDQRTLRAHAESDDYTDIWRNMCRFFFGIKYLEIDITNAYCPLGCHRYVDIIARILEQSISMTRCPAILVFLGTKIKAERARLRDSVRNGLKRAPFYEERVGSLQFKTVPCAGDCSVLHSCDVEDDLGNEELSFQELLSGGGEQGDIVGILSR